MPNIPLKLLDYPENIDLLNPETDGIRKMIDVINSNFLQLMYLLGGHITTENVNTDDLIPDPAVGVYNKYADFYPNMYRNSGFELFDEETLIPNYHETDGVVSNASKFEGEYSLLLTTGQYMEQAEVDGVGFVDPDWWSWCVDDESNIQTRFTIRAKGSSGSVRVIVYQGASPATIWRWVLQEDGTYVKEEGTYLDFDTSADWPDGEITIVASTSPSGGKIHLRVEDLSGTVCLDACSTTPDWTGKWPQVYKPGPNSTSAIVTGDVYTEYGSADWNPSGVEFIFENAYTDLPVATAGVTIDVGGGTGSELATANFILVCFMVKETIGGTDYYSKIQVVPKGSSIPTTIANGKLTLQAVCKGMVAKP